MQVVELKSKLASVLSDTQAAALVQAARKDSILRGKIELLAGGIGKPGLERAVKSHLTALLPADEEDDNELAKLLATSPLPAAPKRKSTKRTSRTTQAATLG